MSNRNNGVKPPTDNSCPRIRISHVCKPWHVIALSLLPTLWTRITVATILDDTAFGATEEGIAACECLYGGILQSLVAYVPSWMIVLGELVRIRSFYHGYKLNRTTT